ncbi:response regulator transcription factor [Pedobacter sp. MW01-1-1]|uniref:response regulator transcription factor n=1 Tax=Pedobacter sp. MW01-1-1 TaxID=3383027 RepID=UPI003FEE4A21
MDLHFVSDLTPKMKQVIKEHDATFNQLPGVVIIHKIADWKIAYMNKLGLSQLKITAEQLYALKPESYYERFFNSEDAADYVPKITKLITENKEHESVSFYQQVKMPHLKEYRWHLSSTRILMRDNENKPLLTVTVSIPVDAMHHMANKANKILEENDFLRKNYHNFAKLSKREQTILKEIALGKSSLEIAHELCISSTTVDTHRRNIREKLNIKSSFEVAQYARAFDLI